MSDYHKRMAKLMLERDDLKAELRRKCKELNLPIPDCAKQYELPSIEKVYACIVVIFIFDLIIATIIIKSMGI